MGINKTATVITAIIMVTNINSMTKDNDIIMITIIITIIIRRVRSEENGKKELEKK